MRDDDDSEPNSPTANLATTLPFGVDANANAAVNAAATVEDEP